MNANRFEAKLNRAVARFAARAAQAASRAAYDMVVQSLELPSQRPSRPTEKLALPPPTTPLWRAVDDFERELITRALTEHRGNVRRTAVALEIGRPTLHHKMTRLGIQASQFRKKR